MSNLPPSPNASPATNRGIEVTGMGTVTAEPGRAELTIGVSAVEDGVAEARAVVAAKMTELKSALVDAGVDEADVRSNAINVHAAQDRDPEGRVRSRRHHVSTSVRVMVEPAERAEDVVNRTMAEVGDGIEIHGLQFGIDEAGAAVGARDAAFADARTKAEHLARLAGVELGSVEFITEGGPGYTPRGMMPMAMARAEASADIPIDPGTEEYRVELTVRWAIT